MSINYLLYHIDEINKINPIYKERIALNQLQTSNALGVSSSTLEAWRRDGIGPSYIKQSASGKKGRVFYPKISIAEWLMNTIKTA